jgi:hypothetical protein
VIKFTADEPNSEQRQCHFLSAFALPPVVKDEIRE